MPYRLLFLKQAKKEWDRLDASIRERFKKKLLKRLENPAVPADRLSGFAHVYKIKLRSSGFRLVYEVKEDEIVVIVLAVGKRENNAVYALLKKRMEREREEDGG